MKSVEQNSALELRAVFLTESGAPAVPSAVHWRVWCLETNQALTDWAAATVETTTNEFGYITEAYVAVEVPGSVNTMQTNRASERKQVVVVADKDLSTEATQPIPYLVRKVAGR